MRKIGCRKNSYSEFTFKKSQIDINYAFQKKGAKHHQLLASKMRTAYHKTHLYFHKNQPDHLDQGCPTQIAWRANIQVPVGLSPRANIFMSFLIERVFFIKQTSWMNIIFCVANQSFWGVYLSKAQQNWKIFVNS